MTNYQYSGPNGTTTKKGATDYTMQAIVTVLTVQRRPSIQEGTDVKELILNALLSLPDEEAEEVVGYLITQENGEELYLDADHLLTLGWGESPGKPIFALSA